MLDPMIHGTICETEGQSQPRALTAAAIAAPYPLNRSRRSANEASRSKMKFVQFKFTGGSAVVKISVRIVFTSQSRASPLITANAPVDASALPKVPTRKSTSASVPASSASPSPVGPRTPTACASST